MSALINAELRRIIGRRGSYFGAIAFAMLIVIIAVLATTPKNGNDAMEIAAGSGRYAGLLGIVVMGALAGSYDTANGTMRYLVLTGVPRWKLAVVHILGMVIAVLPLAALIMAVGIVWGGSEGGMTSGWVFEQLWAVLATFWTWGIVSVAVGMLMRSNGPAIAVSIVLFFGGTLVTSLVWEFVSKDLADLMLPAVFEQVASLLGSGEDGMFDEPLKLSLVGAFAALAAWLAALSGLAILRINRDEY